MALVVYDRVQETGTAVTTVSFLLTGSVTGFQSFAVVGNGNTTYYAATDASGNWEVGLGTYSTTGPTLTRTTILSSSNSNTAVTFVGTCNIFVTYPSSTSVYEDTSGNVTPLGTITSGTWNGTTIGVAYGGTGVTASSGANSVMLRDASQNVTINRLNQANTNTAAAAGTTTLTAASSYSQTLTGTGNQTYTMPDATTLSTGVAFIFNNNATGTLTLQDSASGAIGTITAGGAVELVCVSTATAAGTWDYHGFLPENVTWGTNALAMGSTVVTGGTWQGGTIQSGYGGTGLTTFTAANNALYSTSSSALAAGTLPLLAGGTGKTTAPSAYANLLGWTTTVGTVSTIVLTNTSSSQQNFTGVLSGIQKVYLPDTSTIALGWNVTISDQMTGSHQIEIDTSTGVFIVNCLTGQSYRFVCVSTSVNTVAAWQFYAQKANAEFVPYQSTGNYVLASTVTGSGSAVFSISPTLTGTLGFTGSTTSNIDLGSAQTTGTLAIGGASQTGILTVGQSTVSQTTNIQAGATASGSTKTINLGSGGLAGSTTAITIGSTTGTSTTTLNGTVSLANALAVGSGGTGVTTSTGTGNNVLSISPTFSNQITNYGINTNAATSAGITGGTSAGTLAVPLQTPTATSIFKIAPLGYTGSAWVGGSSLDFVTTAATTSGNRGTNVVLNAIAAGGLTATALTWNGTTLDANGTTLTGNTGTVTSVSASVPAFLSISGSPITTTGTLAITYSGTALPVANGGTGVTTSTGTGSVVLNSSPSLTTPTIGGGGANFSGSTSGTTTLKASAVAGANTITMQATSGTVAFTTDIPSVNNGTLTMNVSGTGLSGSQTFTANQSSSATFTVTSNATNANTASTIVARDASGNFTAGTITAALTGNASTATTAAGLSATLVATSGGTGQSSYAIGDLLYASTTTALSKLADVATGNALISGGIGVAPSWGKIGLTTHVSGTLPIANGGTNATATPTAGGAVYGTGTAYAITAAGTSGQVLTSNGASAPTWAAASAAATSVTLPSTNPFVQNATTLSANLTITGNNAMAAGPITINTSVTLTVATGSRVVIV